jgi:transcription elongation factor GreB
VTVEDEDGQERVFKIVGSDETDAEQGHISWRSPIGAALLGKELDDEVKAQTPAGVRTLAIVGIRYC